MNPITPAEFDFVRRFFFFNWFIIIIIIIIELAANKMFYSIRDQTETDINRSIGSCLDFVRLERSGFLELIEKENYEL